MHQCIQWYLLYSRWVWASLPAWNANPKKMFQTVGYSMHLLHLTTIWNNSNHSVFNFILVKVIWITHSTSASLLPSLKSMWIIPIKELCALCDCLCPPASHSSQRPQNWAGASLVAGAHHQNQWRQPVRRGPVHLLALHHACQDHQGLSHCSRWACLSPSLHSCKVLVDNS